MGATNKFRFYEFFAGGGMARAGLGDAWTCLFANDFNHKKSATYQANWGGTALKTCDVRDLTLADLPGQADLSWGSFPCQDLSLAGVGAGLKGERSGTFWPFWDLMVSLNEDQRGPSLIVLENVAGMLSSHGGKDFIAICTAFQNLGYRMGAVMIDAAFFLPQSRPRLFLIGVHERIKIPKKLHAPEPVPPWHTNALKDAFEKLPQTSKKQWLWWDLGELPQRQQAFAELIEENPTSVRWHTPAETKKLLDMMSKVNLDKVEAAKRSGKRQIGALYKRTRKDKSGRRMQRAEVRFDEIAGCLRTPAGGSSRQLLLIVEGSQIRSRLISSRETARLMGLPDSYLLPDRYNEAYHLTGDGVVVPAVRFLANQILEKILVSVSANNRVVA